MRGREMLGRRGGHDDGRGEGLSNRHVVQGDHEWSIGVDPSVLFNRTRDFAGHAPSRVLEGGRGKLAVDLSLGIRGDHQRIKAQGPDLVVHLHPDRRVAALQHQGVGVRRRGIEPADLLVALRRLRARSRLRRLARRLPFSGGEQNAVPFRPVVDPDVGGLPVEAAAVDLAVVFVQTLEAQALEPVAPVGQQAVQLVDRPIPIDIERRERSLRPEWLPAKGVNVT